MIIKRIVIAAIMLICISAGCNTASDEEYGPRDGIPYSYFLRLSPNEEYEKDYDGLLFRVVDFGYYLDLYITNNGTKKRSFGGEYLIQRNIDGTFQDVAHDSFDIICNGQDVKEMPHIMMKNDPSGTEFEDISEEDIVNIEPGQTIEISLLVLDYEIFASPEYSGEYKLIYGANEVEFVIVCDVAQ